MFNIETYGAVGDGETMNTAAIQAAIDACSAAGGGTVLFPKGVFLSGTLQLKGHITYQFARGAVLKGSGNMEDYRENGFYHNEFKKTVSFLWARDEQNIRLTGDGVIDLSAGLLAPDRSARWYGDGIDEAALTQEQKDECVFYPSQRPTQPIFFESCFDIAVDGIRVIDSPCWTITFSRCQRILVHHIVIDNSLIVSNSDGIHLSACKDAVISDSIFSCGDDCIAVTCITAEGEPGH